MNLTIELRDEVGQALAAKAQELGVSAEEYVRQVVEEQVTGQAPVSEAPDQEVNAGEEPSHWEMFREIWADVPPEVWDKLPKDGASQIDHYIYGTPKRDD